MRNYKKFTFLWLPQSLIDYFISELPLSDVQDGWSISWWLSGISDSEGARDHGDGGGGGGVRRRKRRREVEVKSREEKGARRLGDEAEGGWDGGAVGVPGAGSLAYRQ